MKFSKQIRILILICLSLNTCVVAVGAEDLNADLKNLEITIETKLQQKLEALFTDRINFVVMVHLEQAKTRRSAPQPVDKREADSFTDYGYVPLPMSMSARGGTAETSAPSKLFKIESAEVTLLVPENTDAKTLASAKEIIEGSMQEFKPTVNVKNMSVPPPPEPEKKTPPPPPPPGPSKLERLGPYLFGLVGLLVLFGSLFFMGRDMRASAKTLAEGLSAGLTQLANNSAPALSPASQLPAVVSQNSPQTSGNVHASISSGESAASRAALQDYLPKLRSELTEGLNPTAEAVLIKHLSQLLDKEESVAKAVALLELLGKDVATDIFARLSPAGKRKMVDFVQTGRYDRPKWELMVDSGEELKTKLLVNSLETTDTGSSEKVMGLILQLGSDELFQVAAEISSELLPRFMLYLEAAKVSELLVHFRRGNPNKFSQALAAIPQMAAATKSEKMDGALMTALQRGVDNSKKDTQSAFLTHYQHIVETSDDDMAEEIISELSHDPRIAEFIRENIITMGTFFHLSSSGRKAILDALPNKDIAGLAAGLSDVQQRTILDAILERRRPLIEEEMQSLKSRGGRQLQLASNRVKQIVVRLMKDLKKQGILDSYLLDETVAKESEPTTELRKAA